MLIQGILNPEINALLSRFRHTNTIVIADRGFPYWSGVPTIDLALVDDIPRVTDVLRALLPVVSAGKAWMANEFLVHNDEATTDAFRKLLGGTQLSFEAHPVLKQRVPSAIGLIRTADTTPYSNIILESA